MSTTTQPPKPKRRWYQFSLRTLLGAMLLFAVTVGCAVGWIRYRQQQARENRARVAVVEDAVAAIEELGGEVASSYEARRPQTWVEEQFNDPGGADDPVGVLKVTSVVLGNASNAERSKKWNVQHRVMNRDNLKDADLKHLKELTKLEHLDLSLQTNLTDAGLVHLKGLAKLRDLNLACIDNITDAGLKRLGSLSKLQYLVLSGTKVTDGGLKHLEGMNELQSLGLAFTKVTDAGLEHLKGLESLQSLELPSGNVSEEGVKKLQQALPACKITRVQPKSTLL